MRYIICVLLFIPISLFAQFPIGNSSFSYNDPARANRQIDGFVYYPAVSAGTNTTVATGEFPVIVFGHGFNVAYTEYQVWWEELVPCGYILVFPTTEGGFTANHGEFGADLSFLVDTYLAENTDPTSPFYQKHNGNSAVMGHSMGGGAAFLAAESNPTNINTLVSLAAAETTPSAIAAAANITMPSLTLAGSLDCVAPPADHQILMYNALSSTYKAYIEITNASHCQFGEASAFSACILGEGFACGGSAGSFISKADQHTQMLASTKPWFDFRLKDDCDGWNTFQTYLTTTTTHSYQENGSDGCCIANLNLNSTINSGLYEASSIISANATVANNANVDLQAGDCINLNMGFCTPVSANLEVVIASCP